MDDRLRTGLGWAAAFVAGGVYGMAGTVAQAYRVSGIPVGVVLALVGVTALLIAARTLAGGRAGAFACGVGALGMALVFSGTGPGGSVLVPAGTLGQVAGVSIGLVWVFGLAAAAILVVAWPRTPRPASTDQA